MDDDAWALDVFVCILFWDLLLLLASERASIREIPPPVLFQLGLYE